MGKALRGTVRSQNAASATGPTPPSHRQSAVASAGMIG